MEETIQILGGLRERYEIHHKLRYTDEALVAAAQLAHQYIRYAPLPLGVPCRRSWPATQQHIRQAPGGSGRVLGACVPSSTIGKPLP